MPPRYTDPWDETEEMIRFVKQLQKELQKESQKQEKILVDAMSTPVMQWEKIFINRTGVFLQVVLVVRKGDNPTDILRENKFILNHEQIQRIQYGDAQNTLLSGIRLTGLVQGAMKQVSELVVDRSSPLDRDLNRSSTVIFGYDGRNFTLWPSNPLLPPSRLRLRSATAEHDEVHNRFYTFENLSPADPRANA